MNVSPPSPPPLPRPSETPDARGRAVSAPESGFPENDESVPSATTDAAALAFPASDDTPAEGGAEEVAMETGGNGEETDEDIPSSDEAAIPAIKAPMWMGAACLVVLLASIYTVLVLLEWIKR